MISNRKTAENTTAASKTAAVARSESARWDSQIRLECMRLACQWPTANGAVERAREFFAFVKGK